MYNWPEERLTLTATTPTHDLDSPQYVISLLKTCDYQVIPSHPSSLIYDTENVLLKVLASRQHRDVLLDLALPYCHQPPGQPASKYFGRYLIFNQTLLAIRLASTPLFPLSSFSSSAPTQTVSSYPQGIKKWPAGDRAYHQVPASIRKLYSQEQIKGNDQVLVGDFLIRFRGVQIAMLFQSELAANADLLSKSCERGCGIISVISDQPRLPSFAEKLNHRTCRNRSRCENELMQFGRNKRQAIIYCGTRMATMDGLYLARSFIIQEGKLKQQNFFLFNDGAALSQTLNVYIKPVREGDVIVQDIISGKRPIIKEMNEETLAEQQPLTYKFNNLFRNLQIWYLYKQINKGSPFVISLPLGPTCSELVQQLAKLAKFLNFPLYNFIALYMRNLDYRLTQEDKSYGLIVHQNIQSYIRVSKFQNICIYSQNSQEVLYLTTLVAYYRQKYVIKLCHRLLQFSKTTQLPPFSNIPSLVQKLLQDVTLDMKSLVIQARKNQITNQGMEELMRVIKCKLRASPILTPFFNYIAHSTDQQLRTHMEECEMSLIVSNQNALMNDNQNQGQATQNQCIQISDDEQVIVQRTRNKELIFQRQMLALKRFQEKQMKYKDICCHSCRLSMHKQLSYSCSTCKNEICFACIEKALPNPPQSSNQYQQCIFCKKLCRCTSCTKDLLNLLMPETIKEEQVLLGSRYKQICRVCEIEGRKLQRIKVLCDNCKQPLCYFCQKNKQQVTFSFTKRNSLEELCSKCLSAKIIYQRSQIAQVQTRIVEESIKVKHRQNESRDHSRERTRAKQFQRKKKSCSNSKQKKKGAPAYRQQQRHPIKLFYHRKHRSSSSSSRENSDNRKYKTKRSNSRSSSKDRRQDKKQWKGKQQTIKKYYRGEVKRQHKSYVKVQFKHKTSIKQEDKCPNEKGSYTLWGESKNKPFKPKDWKVEKPQSQMSEQPSENHYYQTYQHFRY